MIITRICVQASLLIKLSFIRGNVDSFFKNLKLIAPIRRAENIVSELHTNKVVAMCFVPNSYFNVATTNVTELSITTILDRVSKRQPSLSLLPTIRYQINNMI